MYGLILGAVSVGRSLYNTDQAAARRQRALDEEVRRFRMARDQEIGSARATAGAAGVEFESGGFQNYIEAMRNEYRRQETWMQQVGAEEIDSMISEGRWNAFADFGNSLSSYGQRNNFGQR